jgi:tetratricopeptide (TPR) repeat protein
MDYYDLGTHSRPVTTSSVGAQTWFDRGLVWLYGYNHEAAIDCFERAIEADPACAMAHWGVAQSVGPNYNKPWETFEPAEKEESLAKGRAAIAAAMSANGASAAERALIEAVGHRYPETPVEDIAPWNDAFAEAMRGVHRAFPGDLDIAALFAEAMMNRTPWKLWDLPTGQPADGADTIEAMEVLERALGQDGAWEHPGLLHFYVHLMEMSPHPERALRHGDRLSTLVPDAGHLLHMGTHIDVLCGDYHSVVARNTRAIEADRRWLEREGPDSFYTVYRCHNYHFKIYGAMFLGQRTAALETADELASDAAGARAAPDGGLVRGVRSDEAARAHPLRHVERDPGAAAAGGRGALCDDHGADALCPHGRAGEPGRPGGSRGRARCAFLAAQAAVPESRMLFNNTCQDILKIAEQMMLGELEYHKGNVEAAFEHLRRAVDFDDTLPYDEPWGWMQPARHALGALLLEQGRLEEAEAVYRADLGLDATLARACQHPQNVWSLHGLHECLTRRGEKVEARHVKLQLDRAAARAEVPIRASCYCRSCAQGGVIAGNRVLDHGLPRRVGEIEIVDEFGALVVDRVDARGVHAAVEQRQRPVRPHPQPFAAIEQAIARRRRHAHEAVVGRRLELLEVDGREEAGMDARDVVAFDEIVRVDLPVGIEHQALAAH